MMEIAGMLEPENEDMIINEHAIEELDLQQGGNSDNKSWPVPMPVATKAACMKSTRCFKRRPYRLKYSYMKNWLMPLDGPMSMEHLHFILDCFVVSFGPEPPQLGRYHPQSDPEEYVTKSEDSWSLFSEDEACSYVTWKKFRPDRPESRFKDPGTSSDSEFRDGEEDIRSFAGIQEYQATSANVEQRNMITSPEFIPPDDMIVRELSEMRLVLERLLENHDLVDWNHHNGLRDILALLPDGNLTPKEPSPHYPVGEWEFHECGICLEVKWLYNRACCDFPACSSCLQKYYASKVDNGQVKIECCNTACNSYVHRDEISARLEASDKETFHKLLILANEDANTKTCPRCSHITKLVRKPKSGESKSNCIICPSCDLEWCFNCHAPWHASLSCKQFRKGDRLLRTWARERNHGQLNAQKCPKCKIYIQRTTGCDHMHCTRCKTDFCYKCGDRFRYLKFFGDHYSKLSIFGCKYRFKADRPLQRKVIRGAIFGGKLMAAPILGALALCAGALAVGVSVFALPVYGGVRLYRQCEGRHLAKGVRRQAIVLNTTNLQDYFISSFSPED